MEYTPESLLCYTEQGLKDTYESMGLTEKRVQESIEAILEWFSKQEHLKEGASFIERSVIERIYLISLGSVEATKDKLEKLMTYRGLIPEFCINRTVEEFQPLLDTLINIPLPKICETDRSRVMVMKFISDDVRPFNMQDFCRYNSMMIDMRLHNDFVFNERYVIDFNKINVNLLGQVNPVDLKKSQVFANLFGSKIKGIHFLNAPWFADRILALFKQTLKEKVANRVYVHPDYEDFHKYVPKEILPKDYGGDEKSCAELAELWRNCFKLEKSRKMFAKMDKIFSDESKRSTWRFNEEYLGVDGSFRKLELD